MQYYSVVWKLRKTRQYSAKYVFYSSVKCVRLEAFSLGRILLW